MICHMHQPNMFMNSYLGYTMWDYEIRRAAHVAGEAEVSDRRGDARRSSTAIPKARRCAATGRDPDFLRRCQRPQSAAQGHAVRRLSRPRLEFPRGLQARPQGQPARRRQQRHLADDDPEKFKKAVHLDSIHVEFGMQCVDCHFAQDATATAISMAKSQAAIEIACVDCHGTATQLPDLRTSGPGGAAGRHRSVAAAHAGRPRALRMARRARSISARRSIPTSNGR